MPRTTWMMTIQQDLKSNNLPEWYNRRGSESSTLETGDCYTLLEVHVREEEEEEEESGSASYVG